jgi:protein TonB
VVLRVAVSQSGTAISVDVITSSGHGMLDAAAAAAVRAWRFAPATRDGVAIVANADVPVDFRMSN